MNKVIINNLLNNKISSLSLSETDENIFKIYLNALKLNNSLITLFLRNVGYYNIQALLNTLKYNKSLKQLYIYNCNYNILSIILSFMKINYYININMSITTYFDLSNIKNISELLIYDNTNIIEMYCIINDEDDYLITNNNNQLEIINNDNNYIENYKLSLLLSYIKPLINAVITNKLLYLHLNFLTLYYNKNLIQKLNSNVKQIYNLSDTLMKRIDITNKFTFL